MKTNTTSKDYSSDAPQLYLNSTDQEKLGILSLADSCKEYWDKIERSINRVQSNLTVTKTSKGYVVLQHGNSVVGFVNGSNVDPAKLSQYLRNNQVNFSRKGENSLEEDMALFG